MGPMTSLVDAAAALLLGAACACCGAAALGLCAACRALLAHPEPRAVPGRVGVPVWAASAYEAEWRRAIVAGKERRAWHLVRPLGDALAVAVAGALRGTGVVGPVLLVPLPSRAETVRERGLDVTAALGRRAASRLCAAGLPAQVENRLRLVGEGVDQGGLGEVDRWRNMAHRLVARPAGRGPPGAVRVVVDDITTTGASLAAAVSALRAVGTPPVAAAVVAATPRRDGRRPP